MKSLSRREFASSLQFLYQKMVTFSGHFLGSKCVILHNSGLKDEEKKKLNQVNKGKPPTLPIQAFSASNVTSKDGTALSRRRSYAIQTTRGLKCRHHLPVVARGHIVRSNEPFPGVRDKAEVKSNYCRSR